MNQNIDEKDCTLEITGGKFFTANKVKIYTDYRNIKIVNESNRYTLQSLLIPHSSLFTHSLHVSEKQQCLYKQQEKNNDRNEKLSTKLSVFSVQSLYFEHEV